MKREMNILDVAAFVREARSLVQGGRIANVYHLGDILLLKIKSREQTLFIVYKLGSFITVSEEDLGEKREPTAFCKILRKYLRGGIIKDIFQPQSDRIIEVKVSSRAGDQYLVFELMRGGNIILLDSARRVVSAHRFTEYRDHVVKPNTAYIYPPVRGTRPDSSLDDYLKYFSESNSDVVRTLARYFNLSGELAEEVCARAGVPKNAKASSLQVKEIKKLREAALDLLSRIAENSLDPTLYIKDSNYYSFSPVDLTIYRDLVKRKYSSFCQLVYEYFKKTVVESLSKDKYSEFEEKKMKLEASIRKLEEAVKENEEKARLLKEKGHILLSNMHLLEKLLQGEKVDLPAAIKLNSRKVIVEGIEVPLPTTAGKIVEKVFEKAKEYERKASVGREKIKELLKKIEELESKKTLILEKTLSSIRKPEAKEKWFEQFLWFYTSEGFLVIGGKTAAQNEVVVKKYLKPGDLFFHADIHGGSAVVLKEGEKAGPQSIQEAAIFAASYSRAWTAGFSSIDVYYVKADQVSKTPPSGEYLAKGAFMIRGKRNYIKAELKLAIGIEEKTMKIIAGPPSAIVPKSLCYVILVPGRLDKNLVANKIKDFIKENTGLKADLNKILRLIPGNSTIMEKRKSRREER